MKTGFSRRHLLIPAAIVALIGGDVLSTNGQEPIDPRGVMYRALVTCTCPSPEPSCSNSDCIRSSYEDALSCALTVIDGCCASNPNCTVDIVMINTPDLNSEFVEAGRCCSDEWIVEYTCTGRCGGQLTGRGRGRSYREAYSSARLVACTLIELPKYGGACRCWCRVTKRPSCCSVHSCDRSCR